MTSSEPLVELVLRTLREAEPGSCMHINRAEQFDLEQARGLDGSQRLTAFDQIQTLVEAFGFPPASREPIRYTDLRM